MPKVDNKLRYRKELGRRLKITREGLRWTQDEMATALGVEKLDTYKKWEQGTSAIPHFMLPRFCEITHTDPWWLLTGRHGGFTSPPSGEPLPFKKRA